MGKLIFPPINLLPNTSSLLMSVKLEQCYLFPLLLSLLILLLCAVY